MGMAAKIYEFAASVGAFEGYVYSKAKEEIDMHALPNWVNNLVTAYQHLPSEVRAEFQSSLDGTLGRAIRSLVPLLGEEHEIIRSLKSMVVGSLPRSANDFEKKKRFEE